MKNVKKQQSGQVLLIGIMLVAVLLTVVFSAAFVSRTDTQISKLEEENQKTLAAAEAGVEVALKSGAITDISKLNVPPGFTGSATIQTASSNSFITPLIKKGSQYTFYLSTPGGPSDNPDFNILTSSYNNNTLTFCSNSDSFAISLSFLKSDGTIKRFAINPSTNPTLIANGQQENTQGNCPGGQDFPHRHRLAPVEVGAANNLLLFVKLVGSGTGAKIGIVGGSDLPLQGRTVVSQATSPTGVTKTVKLFQSYPQIPSEFFVTSF